MTTKTNTCVDLERIYDIAHDFMCMTKKEKDHISKCQYCRNKLKLALLFQGMKAELSASAKRTEAEDMTFPDPEGDELLLAGAGSEDGQNKLQLPFTYVASDKNEEDKDYWKAILTVSFSQNSEQSDKVIIELKVDDGGGKGVDGTFFLSDEPISIEDGAGAAIMAKDFCVSSILLNADSCSFMKSFTKEKVKGELLLCDE